MLERTAAALLVVLTWGSVDAPVDTTSAGRDGTTSLTDDRVELVDMPDELADMASSAIALFDEAGLRLPPLEFVYHGDDRTACSGWAGVHRHVDGRSSVHICTSEPGPVTEALVLHETAHAWAAHDLPEDRKRDFRSLRGWTVWSDHGTVDWHENGSEQAAEIMVWGLMDRPIGIVTIHDSSCADLEAGFRALTGQGPLHGYRDHC